MSRDRLVDNDPVSADLPRLPGAPSTLVDGLLEDDRATLDEVPAPVVDAMFHRVAGMTVDKEATLLDRVRELATPARVAIAFFAVLGAGATLLALMGMRADLDLNGTLWLLGVHSIVVVGSILGLSLALRPAHRRPLNGLAWAAVAALLVLPFGLSVVPGILPGMTGEVPAFAHVMCAAGGLIVALPATLCVLLLDRSGEPSAWRVLLAAGAAGLAAFGFGHWHCPSADPAHLVMAHAGLGTGLGLVVLLIVRAVSWWRRRNEV